MQTFLLKLKKKFDTCILSSGIRARFDFWVNNQYIIEFDGRQHFSEMHSNFFADSLEEIQERDAYKTKWCVENNIPIIRIPYTRLKNLCIEDLQLNSSQFLVK